MAEPIHIQLAKDDFLVQSQHLCYHTWNQRHNETEQNPGNTTETINPNTQAPDEVLKSEAEQEFNPVEEPENITDAGAQLPETPEGSAEQPPVTEESVQSGGIPGEVLKSDVE